MDVRLKPELERFVEDQVKAGRFATQSDVVEAGLARLLLDNSPSQDDLEAEDIQTIDKSEQQIAQGQDLDWKKVSARLRQEYLGQ